MRKEASIINKTVTKALIFGSLGLIIFLAFIFLALTFFHDDVSEEEVAHECREKETQEDSDRCFLDLSFVEDDGELCEYIEHTELRDECFGQYAYAQEVVDPDICERIRDEESRDLCFDEAAYDNENPALCDMITDSDIKQECHDWIVYGQAYSSENAEQCGEIQTTEIRDDCYIDLVMLTGDRTACQYVSDETEREWCEDLE